MRTPYSLLFVPVLAPLFAGAQGLMTMQGTSPSDLGDARGGWYCDPIYSIGPTDGDFIQSVAIGDLDNVSGDNFGSPYSSYFNGGTGTTTRVVVGNVYQLTVVSGSYDPTGPTYEGYAVWIDYDHSGTFDGDENIGTWTTVDPYFAHVINFNIAFDAEPGYTRMRVRNAYNYSTLAPCDAYSYGECEDYMILIEDGSTCIPLIPWGPSDGDEITNVVLGGMGFNFSMPDHFPWMNNLVAGRQLVMGSTYDLDITPGAYAPEYVGAWIDWNGDTDFDDAGELIGIQQAMSAFQTITFQVTPPFQRHGYRRMRIRAAFGQPAMTACSDAYYGETEDYTVSVRAPAMPCLPLLGYGAATGGGITAFNLQGTDYAVDNGGIWPYYSFHNITPHRFIQGQFYFGSLTTGASATDRYDLLLDLNGDGDMDDANELLWTGDNSGPYELMVMSFTIPATCAPGQYMMRLRGYPAVWAPGNTCENQFQGEIEDIVVVVEENGGYCLPWSNWWTTDGDFIDGFQLNTVSNTPNGALYGPAYHDYTAMSTGLERGASYTAYVIGGAFQPDAYSVYIDYDQNGILDEVSESIGMQNSSTPYQWLSFPFTVPMNALLGETRLRVRCAYGSFVVGPCADHGFGETEDYTVDIYTTTSADARASDALRAWPDASAGVLHVWNAAPAGAPCEVIDATGRVVRTDRVGADRFTIACGGLAAGPYTLRINGDAHQVVRFVWAE